MCYKQNGILELATFLILAFVLVGCLSEQHTSHLNNEDYQRPHFDSVILSGPPLNNIHQVNQHADVLHSKNNRSLAIRPSSSAHDKGITKIVGNNTGQDNNLKIKLKKDQEIDLLPALQKNLLIQNLMNAESNSTNEINMTIYVIKQTKDLNHTRLNTSNIHQGTKNLSRAFLNEGIDRYRNNMSRKGVAQNITVFLDTPESVESNPTSLPHNDNHTFATIKKEQQVLKNILKTWSWNQRTRSRWPMNRRVGGRRPSQRRRPSSGWRVRPGQGVRPPQGGWTRPTQGGNQVNSLRPNQGGAGGQPSGGGSNGGGSNGGGSNGGGSSSANQGDSEFEQEALEAHNRFRAVHNAPPMRLNNELNQQAKAYAQKIAALGALQHSSSSERGQDVGENLAMGCSSFGNPMSGKKAVTNWYNEVCQYNFNNPSFSMETGHFTQVVWQDSTELGIGKASGRMGQMPCVYVVGRYRTAGNFNNMFRQQVLIGAFDQSYCNNLKNDEK